jgi:hypothetical protein
MIYKISIETTEEAMTRKEVETALSDLNITLGDDLISWSENQARIKNLIQNIKWAITCYLIDCKWYFNDSVLSEVISDLDCEKQ